MDLSKIYGNSIPNKKAPVFLQRLLFNVRSRTPYKGVAMEIDHRRHNGILIIKVIIHQFLP